MLYMWSQWLPSMRMALVGSGWNTSNLGHVFVNSKIQVQMQQTLLKVRAQARLEHALVAYYGTLFMPLTFKTAYLILFYVEYSTLNVLYSCPQMDAVRTIDEIFQKLHPSIYLSIPLLKCGLPSVNHGPPNHNPWFLKMH